MGYHSQPWIMTDNVSMSDMGMVGQNHETVEVLPAEYPHDESLNLMIDEPRFVWTLRIEEVVTGLRRL